MFLLMFDRLMLGGHVLDRMFLCFLSLKRIIEVKDFYVVPNPYDFF